jgi:CHAT domain-containing protein/Flp pilus assembly protein TadD
MSLFPFPGRPSQHRYRRALRWGVPGILLSSLLSACAGVAPALPGSETVLRNGFNREREGRAGEQHFFPVILETGQFLRVIVDQNGVDALVRLLDPDGTQVFAVDSPNGADGDEDFAVLAQEPGLHRIEVSMTGGEGGYTLKVEGPRLPTDRDRLRVDAVRATQEALTREGEKAEDQVARYEKALGLWKELGELRRQADMLYRLADTHASRLGQIERAIRLFSEAAALWGRLGNRGMGDLRLCVEALNEAGLLHEQLSQWKEAQALFEEALAVATKAENLKQQAAMHNNLGRIAQYRGDVRAGIEFFRESIRLAQQSGEKKIKASALNNLGAAYMDLSDRQQALRAYKEALEICRREIEDPETESSVLNNLGDAYESLGEWETALEHHNESLRLHRELGDPISEAITLNNIGVVHLRLGDTGKALEHYGKALAIVEETGDEDRQARFLTNQAFVHLLRGEAETAREASLRALGLAGSRGDIEVEAEARHALGSAYRLLGNHEAARRELEQALARGQERGDRNRQAEVKLTLARLEKDRGNLAQALSLARESVDIVESLRTGVVSQDLRASFLASKQTYYEFQIDILMALHGAEPDKGHAAEAFRVSEQARARSLLEILQEGGADIRQGAPAELLDRERRLRDEISARELQRLALRGSGTASPEELAEAENRLKESLDEYRGFQEELLESSSRYATLTQPRPLKVSEIQSQVLDGDALLLEYFLGSERSYLWAVTPDSLQSFTLPPRDSIQKVARRYYGQLTARNQPEVPAKTHRRKDADAEKTAAELSGIILEPVRHLLKGQPLLVVADGALQYIPFAALPLPGTTTHLIQQHEVVSLPSASALAVLRQEARDRPVASLTLAVLADPVFRKEGEDDFASFRRLIHSRKEAETIASLLPPEQTFKALDVTASRATALSGKLADYRYVHFATHGDIKSDHPELSSLVLSLYDERGKPVDGFLRLNDIYNLELRADLVVLSACRTALGKEIRGEGLIGLTRGFMYAGTSRVVATLWSVDDLTTAEFMKHFYRAMLNENEKLSPAAALRQAQLAMIRKPNRKLPPYFWAGYSLQGEWR